MPKKVESKNSPETQPPSFRSFVDYSLGFAEYCLFSALVAVCLLSLIRLGLPKIIEVENLYLQYFTETMLSALVVPFIIISIVGSIVYSAKSVFNCLLTYNANGLFLSVASFCINMPIITPYVLTSNHPSVTSKNIVSTASNQTPKPNTLKFLSANVLSSNQKYSEALETFKKQNPDYLLVYEVDESWGKKLETLKEIFPYYKILASPDNFGIAILSKTPFDSVEIISLDLANKEKSRPIIVAKTKLNGTPLTIVAVHLIPPIGTRGFQRRNLELSALKKFISELPDPHIVLGDLNITAWERRFQEFLESTSLKDTRVGVGLLPTWPSFFGFFGIPIDYILLSKDLFVTELSKVEIAGSDHAALFAEIRFGAIRSEVSGGKDLAKNNS